MGAGTRLEGVRPYARLRFKCDREDRPPVSAEIDLVAGVVGYFDRNVVFFPSFAGAV
jgi:hypothetical protein